MSTKSFLWQCKSWLTSPLKYKRSRSWTYSHRRDRDQGQAFEVWVKMFESRSFIQMSIVLVSWNQGARLNIWSSHRDQEWGKETLGDKQTASKILQPYRLWKRQTLLSTMKCYGFMWWFTMSRMPPTEILLRPDEPDLESRKHVNSPLDHNMKQDCVNTSCPITMVSATAFFFVF